MTQKNKDWNENKPKFNEGDYVFEKPNVFDSGIIKSYAFSNGIHRYIVDFFGQQIGYREDELALVGCVDDLKKALEISPKQKVDCDKCSGKGYYYDDDNDLINCPRCHGEGTHTKELELEELQAKSWKQRYPNGFKNDK